MGDGGLFGARVPCVLIIVALVASSGYMVGASGEVVLEYFWHPDCAPCGPSKRLIEELEVEYYPHLVVEWRNMEHREAMELFLEYQLSRRPAVVFNHDPGTALYDLGEETLRSRIESLLAAGDSGVEDGGSDSVGPDASRFVTVPLVIVAGLVDGINPCAFSLLIFFLSFLFGIRRSRLNVLGMGLMYVAGVFLGYLGLGLGLLRTVSLLGVEHLFGLLSVALLSVMGLLQLREATTLGARVLKFPGFAVPTFRGLTERASLPVALGLGCVVSLFEFPCSGAVYVGILVLLASRTSFIGGLLYLVLYNVMFVAPLILLLLLASNADILLRMDEWRVVRRRRMKLLSGVFLLSMAALMAYWLLRT